MSLIDNAFFKIPFLVKKQEKDKLKAEADRAYDEFLEVMRISEETGEAPDTERMRALLESQKAYAKDLRENPTLSYKVANAVVNFTNEAPKNLGRTIGSAVVSVVEEGLKPIVNSAKSNLLIPVLVVGGFLLLLAILR